MSEVQLVRSRGKKGRRGSFYAALGDVSEESGAACARRQCIASAGGEDGSGVVKVAAANDTAGELRQKETENPF